MSTEKPQLTMLFDLPSYRKATRPDVPMFPEPRLNQDALTGDNFARIVFDKGE